MKESIEYQNIQENRKYKDALFRMVFREKKYLLELYNAINGTDYQNEDDLEVNTLENVLYMGMKNDVSFLIGCTMNLYEHQSTKNANMPLRGLLYFAKLFEEYVTENALDIYGSKICKLPTPYYIVFYNGEQKEPDERILKLSDAFSEGSACLECKVRLLNINYGHNRDILEKCRRLEEYAIFVAKVRMYQKNTQYTLKQAIIQAMEECIKEGILTDILTKQKAEVLGVLLSTFNKELYEKNLKEDAYYEGEKIGFSNGVVKGAHEKLRTQIEKKLEKGKAVEEIAEELEESVDIIKEMINEIEAVRKA